MSSVLEKNAPSAFDSETEEQASEKPTSLKRLFHGWLREVPPGTQRIRPDVNHDVGIRRVFPLTTSTGSRAQISKGFGNPGTPLKKWKILTIRELLGLTRATVRESETHRTWPPEVVLKFMAADVVKRTNRQQ